MDFSAYNEVPMLLRNSLQRVVRIDMSPILVWTAVVQERWFDLTVWIGKIGIFQVWIHEIAKTADGGKDYWTNAQYDLEIGLFLLSLVQSPIC